MSKILKTVQTEEEILVFFLAMGKGKEEMVDISHYHSEHVEYTFQ